jgi:iron complex transport system substrate-binding protein
MLRRLGVEVLEVPPATGLADIADRMRMIGDALGRDEAAAARVARYEADLAALRAEVARRPRAALYYANGYTAGDRTLAGEILIAAGFANVAGELGLPGGGMLSLEELVMSAPELVVTGRPGPGASRADEVTRHPALDTLDGGRDAITDRDWICGTPRVLRAIGEMAKARERLGQSAPGGAAGG